MKKVDEIMNMLHFMHRKYGSYPKSITMSEIYFTELMHNIESTIYFYQHPKEGEPYTFQGVPIYRTIDLKEGFEVNI